MNGHPYARLNTFHGPKRQLLGNHAGHAPPAWKTAPIPVPNAGKGKQVQHDLGSKIFLSRLPLDVKETEVDELFRKTIGPLRESFLVYNSQGNSKGMAVVTFARPGDALLAKAKYDGKVVDGRRPLKIEIITEGTGSTGAQAAPPPAPSLLNRIAGSAALMKQSNVAGVNGAVPPVRPKAPGQNPRVHAQTIPPAPAAIPLPPRRIRQKKGPKRIKKRQAAVTAAQLDQDMEDYRASADMTGL
ncbi:hypothetical protein H0H92_002725 [Tricholoma furcatifolium]|nr:hypothetical protein H0H92_002725 [Tricholoma furcatifolium]